MGRMKIDTHTHSSYSDGTDTPRMLMEHARDVGVGMIALTDHDTTAGWSDAQACVEDTHVALIRGMEVTTSHCGIPVHVLAYLFNPAHEAVQEHYRVVLASRVERMEEMVERIAKDYPITLDDVEAQVGGASVGRPHIADALVAAGVCVNRDEAFRTILSTRGPYYVPQRAPDTREVIEWIGWAGGKSVVAHPLAPARGQVLDAHALHAFVEAGLFGVEVYHRENPESLRPWLIDFATHNALECFGASDYHGTGKVNELGENTSAPHVIDVLSDGSALDIIYPH